MTAPAKFVSGIVLTFLAAIVCARIAFEATSAPAGEPSHEPWAMHKMEFLAWNGERWTAWIHEGTFELVPENAEVWHRHANTTIAFIGWQGDAWQAKIEGDEFLLAHRGEWHGERERSPAIRYRDWEGQRRLRTVEQLSR